MVMGILGSGDSSGRNITIWVRDLAELPLDHIVAVGQFASAALEAQAFILLN